MGGFSTCEYSADSKRILYDNVDYGVYISDILSGKMVSVQYAEYILALAFCPGRKIRGGGSLEGEQG